MRRAHAERGSALLLSILAIAALGAGLMGVLMLSGAERRAVLDQQASVDAFAVAEGGLQTFVANRAALGFTSSPAAAYESTRVSVPGGYADVVLQRLRPSVGGAPALYVIHAQGFAVQPQLSGTPIAGRRVAQLAVFGSGSMTPLAAFTSLSGIYKRNASGTLNGADACGTAASVAGVAVPTVPGYVQESGKSAAAGSPPILDLGLAGAAAATVGIDWAGILAGTAMTPDLVIPGAAWPSFPASYWPVILVNGDFTLPGNGQGTLIVTGSLTINKSRTWNGVIIVGDEITATSSFTVRGSAVSGLNVKLGQNPPRSDLGNGTRTFQYDSCNIASALGRFGGLQLLRNASSDGWSGY